MIDMYEKRQQQTMQQQHWVEVWAQKSETKTQTVEMAGENEHTTFISIIYTMHHFIRFNSVSRLRIIILCIVIMQLYFVCIFASVCCASARVSNVYVFVFMHACLCICDSNCRIHINVVVVAVCCCAVFVALNLVFIFLLCHFIQTHTSYTPNKICFDAVTV